MRVSIQSRFQCILFLSTLFMAGSTSTALAADAVVPSEKQETFFEIVLMGANWLGPVMAILSLWSVSIIFEHFWSIRRSTMVTEIEVRETRELVEKRLFKECIEKLSKSRTMFGDVLTVGLRHGRHGFDAMQESVEERAMAWRSRLFRRVEYLNILGNICPLLGLLGTVMGMIEAFQRMRSGAYGADNLAGGISLALVSTFMGLVVAIVSMLFFGICRNRVDSLTVAAHASAVDILEYFRPAQFAPGAPGSVPSVTQSPAAMPQPIGAPLPRPVGGPMNTSGPVQLSEG